MPEVATMMTPWEKFQETRPPMIAERTEKPIMAQKELKSKVVRNMV